MESLAYVQPKAADVKEMTLEAAEEIDKKNKEIHSQNKKIAEAAKLILLDVEPTNRQLRDLEIGDPPPSIAEVVQERLDKEAEKQEEA